MKKSFFTAFVIFAAFMILTLCAPASSAQAKKRVVKRTTTKKTTTGRTTTKKTTKTVIGIPMSINNPAATRTASGLIYMVTKQGTGAQLKAGDEVIVHYTGLFTNGKMFDSSHDRGEPLSFRLGAGRVIEGWDEGLQKLRVGDHATLIIPAAIAYGEQGAGNGAIPPNSTLVFLVEIVGVK
jgi:FKBP-type peptidyl-prolyl cis-trans isomerase